VPWIIAGGLVAAFACGYLIAAFALFPAPIFATRTAIPHVVGMEQATAEAALQQAGLALGQVSVEAHPGAARGDVVWQDPPPGVAVRQGQSVELTVSSGPPRIPVPDLIGYDIGLAEQMVEAAGLVVGRRERTQAPAPKNVVITSRPPAGVTLLPGSEVALVVSVGAPTITVPDLTGMTREEAEAVLSQAGLALGTSMRRNTEQFEAGRVMAQNPAAGTLSAPGTAINITLAQRRGQ
jgi:serine/threonine-protein kinase